VTGVSIQRMVKKLDAGPVAAYLRTDVGPAESAGELTARLAILGGGLLVTVLDSMEARTARFTDQDEALATVAPKLTKDSGTIDWARPAAEIERLIRAMTPWPGAFTFLHRERQGSGAGSTSFERRGEPPLRLKLLRAEVKEWVAKPETPGTIVDLPAEHSSSLPRSLGVTTSEGLLVILEVQPEGGKAMGGADFLRGQRLTRGANLQS
jgi:methionyl-tRNA formyltransferase